MTPFGQALEQLLHENHVSQSELARRLDLTSSAVNSWVKGKSLPTRDNINRIEDELAVDPRGSLLAAAGYSQNNDAEGPTVESLIRTHPRLDAEDKRVILRILRLALDRHTET